MPTVILTYHAVEPGRSPLCVEPVLFREHLDCMVEVGVRSVTIAELRRSLASRDSGAEPTVAITFDDGFASVADAAAPMLVERGLTATVFCVAGHLGGRSAWESASQGAFESRLASPEALRGLVGEGFEIGSHGMTHAPLVADDQDRLRHEIVGSRSTLESLLETPVGSFAYPYGARPSVAARQLVEATYDSACTTRLAELGPDADVYALPRIDAHYLRSPALLRRALAGSLGPYLLARRLGARARRALRTDYSRVA